MVSEAMVTTYLETQVRFAAWQAVLRMVPAGRGYDLEMVKQAPVDVSYLIHCCVPGFLADWFGV